MSGIIGPRVLRIGFDCEPVTETVAQEKLASISPFVKRETDEKGMAPYRWGLRISLHPIVQNRSAKDMVHEVCRKLDLPVMVFVAWHDTMEDGP